jgi:hypothetical protein
MLRYLLLCVYLLLLSHSGFLVAASTLVLVSREDADSAAIASIIEGIKGRNDDLEVQFTDNPGRTILKEDNETSSIILGRSLLESAVIIQPQAKSMIEGSETIQANARLVGGGYYGNLLPAPSFSTYALDPSISTTIDEIRKTGFPLKRLLTVVTNQESKEQVERITRTLDQNNVQVIVSESSGARSTARAWFELIASLDPASDVLWIVDDRHLEDSGSYKHIIESAWKKKILVVSALPNYANRGVSIGFVPDLRNYGQFLFDEVNNIGVNEKSSARYATTRFLRRVYNQRTLEHIGYGLPGDIDRLELDDIIIR